MKAVIINHNGAIIRKSSYEESEFMSSAYYGEVVEYFPQIGSDLTGYYKIKTLRGDIGYIHKNDLYVIKDTVSLDENSRNFLLYLLNHIDMRTCERFFKSIKINDVFNVYQFINNIRYKLTEEQYCEKI